MIECVWRTESGRDLFQCWPEENWNNNNRCAVSRPRGKKASSQIHFNLQLELTPSSRVLMRSWRFLNFSRNYPHFTESVGLLPRSQEPITCPYPEPDESNPRVSPYLFFKISFNTILWPMPRSSKRFLSFRSPHQNRVCNSPVSHMRYMPCPSHSVWFDHPNSDVDRYRS